MPETYDRYGLKLDLAVYKRPWACELFLAYNDDARMRFSDRVRSRAEHLKNAITMAYSDDVFTWHRWADDYVESWFETNSLTVWGPSSTTKSGMAGMILWMDLLYAPLDTYTLMITNPLEKHWDRAYGSLLQWRKFMEPEFRIGSERRSNPLGLLTSGGDGKRTGIICISNRPGDSWEDLKRYLGTHVRRNRLMVDEPQSASRSVLRIKINMMASGDYKEIFAGNPDGWANPLGEHSMPADGDRRRIMVEQPDTWETRNRLNGLPGKAIVFDSRKAPSLTDPKRYWFMIQPDFIESMRGKEGGEDGRYYWTYVIGRIPPDGFELVVMGEADASLFGCYRQPAWEPGWVDFAGLDASQSGDCNCVLTRLRVGKEVGGDPDKNICCYIGREYLNRELSKGNVIRQVGDQVAFHLEQWGIPAHRLGVDTTGNQGAVADVVEESIGKAGVVRVDAGSAPTDRPVSKGSPVKCKERYYSRSTELLMNLAVLARAGQLCGLDNKVVEQLSTRKLRTDIDQDDTRRNRRQAVEKKEDWSRVHGGVSPDEGDSFATGVEAAVVSGMLVIGDGVDLEVSRQGFGETAGGAPWAKPRQRTDSRTRAGRVRALVARAYR